MKATYLLILSAAAPLAIAVPAQAQFNPHPMGFSAGWDEPALSPGGTTLAHNPQTLLFASGGDFLTRIDHEDYSNWGMDPVLDPSYGTFTMVGMEFVTEDADLATPEFPFYVTGWTEDPAKANFPDVPGFDPVTGGSNFLFAGPIFHPIPPDPDAAPALLWTITFDPQLGPAVTAPTGSDLFLGLSFGPVGVGEGLFTHAVNDGNVPLPNPTLFDNPGPAGASIAESSYVCVVPTQTFAGNPPPPPLPTGADAVYAFYMAQNRFELYLQNASGGVCTAVTNQESYVTSNIDAGFGTPNFLSGLHPDASSIPTNVGRNLPEPPGWTGDRIGFIYSDSRLPPGSPVAIIVSTIPAVQAITLSNLPAGVTGPNPTGQILIDFIDNIVAGTGLTTAVGDPFLNYSQFSLSIELPPVTRDLLQTEHPTLYWQGFGLDLATGNFHASGLAAQHF